MVDRSGRADRQRWTRKVRRAGRPRAAVSAVNAARRSAAHGHVLCRWSLALQHLVPSCGVALLRDRYGHPKAGFATPHVLYFRVDDAADQLSPERHTPRGAEVSLASELTMEVGPFVNLILGSFRGFEPGERDDGERQVAQAPAASPEEKWEVFLEVTSQEVSQADAARKGCPSLCTSWGLCVASSE